jgi:hypothetical protein
MAEIQENIINRSKIKDSINPNDLPDLSFSIPTDPNTISNSRIIHKTLINTYGEMYIIYKKF